jgi:hypothetical protein
MTLLSVQCPQYSVGFAYHRLAREVGDLGSRYTDTGPTGHERRRQTLFLLIFFVEIEDDVVIE